MAAVLIPLAISAAITAASTGLEYLLAKKQKVNPIDRGKVDDIRFSLPGYGESIVWSRGIVRGAPTWFWHTPTVDIPVTTPGHSGGKGAPKPPTPTEIEHRYFKSLAGVFHDGEIQGVRRMWFNQELVWNLNIANLSSVRYEAESATLNGTATITSASYASNGAGVTLLGVGGGNNGSVDFAVSVPDTGDYDIAIWYQFDSGSYTFEVRLDGVLQGSVTPPPSGSGVIGVTTIGFPMTAGAHTIRIGNTSGQAPNLDCIDVIQTVSFTGGSTVDNRVVTELIDPTATPPTDQTKAFAFHNARPLELSASGAPLAGTSSLSATLSKWGNPQIRFYRGTTTQDADPAIIADKGAGNTPAWRGLAYVVIENILLPNAQVPNVTIEWDQGTSAVDTIVQDLYALGGVSSGDLDLTALSGLTIMGVIRTEQKAIGDTLKDLQTRFQFDMVEVDGKVKAILRNSNTPDLTISFAKLRAHGDGSEMPTEDAIIKDIDPRDLPYEVQVNYLDPGNDFHNGMQADNRASGPQTQPVSVSLALVDNKDNMKKLASKLLYKPDMEGREFTIQTGPEYITAIPGTIIDLVLSNATHRTRVVDAKYGLPAGVCEFQLVRQAASLYSATGFGSISGRENPVAGFPSNTKGIILDRPLFRPEDAGDGSDPVWYIGMCGIGGGAWGGAFLHQESPFNSGNYELMTSANLPSGIGVTSSALPSVVDTTVWDTTSTLVVKFYYDPQLSNATTGDIENNPNLNLLAIKNPSTGEVEVVQFKNATPGSSSSPFVAQYTLDNFLRGRFLTEGMVGTHSSSDEVVFIDSTIKPRRQRAEDIGKTLKLKFQTSGQLLDNVPVQTEVLYGYSLRPPRPTDFSGIWYEDSDDLLLEWEGARQRGSAEGEIYDLQISIPGNGSFASVRPAVVERVTPANYIAWEIDDIGDLASINFVQPGGFDLNGHVGSPGQSGSVRSKNTTTLNAEMLFEFQLIDSASMPSHIGLRPTDETLGGAHELVWGLGATGYNPGDTQPDGEVVIPSAPQRYWVTANGVEVAAIIPGDRLGILIGKDKIARFVLNYFGPQTVPLVISEIPVRTDIGYRAVAGILTSPVYFAKIRRTNWARPIPEWVYTADAQRDDNSSSLPSTIKARIRQRSFYSLGPPSDWTYGTFNRP